MKIKLLIATADSEYAEHLSSVLAKKYADTFEVSVGNRSKLSYLYGKRRFMGRLSLMISPLVS